MCNPWYYSGTMADTANRVSPIPENLSPEGQEYGKREVQLVCIRALYTFMYLYFSDLNLYHP